MMHLLNVVISSAIFMIIAPNHLHGAEMIPLADCKSDLQVYQSGDLWGFRDSSGDVTIEPRFEEARPFCEGLAAVKEKGNWFYINLFGEPVTENFSLAGDFNEGMAPVKVELKWALLDRETLKHCTPQFFKLRAFANGLAPAQVLETNGSVRAGYINRSCEVTIPATFEDTYEMSASAGVVKTNGYFAIISRTGGTLLHAANIQELKGTKFERGKVTASIGGKWFYIDESGREITKGYDELADLNDGFFRARTGSKWVLLDRTGQEISKLYDRISAFSKGLAWGFNQDSVVLIDLRGQEVGKSFNEMSQFDGEYARARTGKKWSLINKKGQEITRLFLDIGKVREGFVPVRDRAENPWGYLKISGENVEWFANPQFYEAGDFSNGTALVWWREVLSLPWGNPGLGASHCVGWRATLKSDGSISDKARAVLFMAPDERTSSAFRTQCLVP